jgi:hypothetical protein
VQPDWFVRAGLEVAAVQDEWVFPLPDETTALSLGAGLRTRIGPVTAQITKVVDGPEPRVSVSVGRSF